jgi:hypothetical protein
MDWLTQKLQLIYSVGKAHMQIILTSSGATRSLLFNGCWGYKGQNVKISTHFHLLHRLRMCIHTMVLN